MSSLYSYWIPSKFPIFESNANLDLMLACERDRKNIIIIITLLLWFSTKQQNIKHFADFTFDRTRDSVLFGCRETRKWNVSVIIIFERPTSKCNPSIYFPRYFKEPYTAYVEWFRSYFDVIDDFNIILMKVSSISKYTI